MTVPEPIEFPAEDSKRTPAFHLSEAEAHLLAADELASRDDPRTVARLLAAVANAQIGALKLSLQQDGMQGAALDQLYALQRIADSADQTARNTAKPRTGY